MEEIDLNLIPDESPPVCHVSQFDVGRQIKANLFDGSNVYTLTGNETIDICVRKPDAHTVTQRLTATAGTHVIIETTEQMTAVNGTNLCEISIANGSTLIGTLNFLMEVEEDPLNGGVTTIEAYRDLEQQVINIVNSL